MENEAKLFTDEGNRPTRGPITLLEGRLFGASELAPLGRSTPSLLTSRKGVLNKRSDRVH
ncbi:hypothetical protein J6590_041119, partial [Homalodisca vitripennis]